MMDMALSVRDLHFAVNGVMLLNGIDAQFPRGGCTVLLGPNGAGKSLLMRIAHGLLPATRGEIIWAQNGGAPLRHAMVAQRPLMMRRSARANLVHALALAGVDYATRHRQARDVLQKFRLDHLAERPATRLSGGEQQRLAIARAAAIKADVILLDEPTAALDPAATREIEDMIGTLRAEGVTVIFSTHAIAQAKRLAGHVLLLNRGSVIEAGPASSFFKNPQSAAAQAFLAGDLLL